jgi:threonine/homoserine/homoserine lactone efflux protein
MQGYLILGVAYGFTAAMQPGPFLTYLAAKTLHDGWKRTFPIVFAPLLSDGPIILLVLSVLSGVPEWWIQVLRFSGGCFLLYLAIGTLKACRQNDGTAGSADSASRHGVLRAALVNVLNPGTYLFWGLVTGPLLLKGWNEKPLNGIMLLAGFYLAMMVTLSSFVLLFSLAGNRGAKFKTFLLCLSGAALAVLGLYQILKGLSGLSVTWP